MNVCVECGKEVDDFEICNHDVKFGAFKSRIKGKLTNESNSEDFDDFTTEVERSQKRTLPYIYAPLSGLLFDFIFPIWPNWWQSCFYILAGSLIVNQFVAIRTSRTTPSAKNFFRGLLYNLNTPKIIRVKSSTEHAKRNLITWIGMLVASFVLIFMICTPGNSSGLEKRITAKVKETTGLNSSASCPKLFFAYPGSQVTCRIKKFGITLPIVVKFDNPLTDPTWKLDF